MVACAGGVYDPAMSLVRRLFRLRIIAPLLMLAMTGVAAYWWTQAGAIELPIGDTTVTVGTGPIEETMMVTGLVRPSVTIELRSDASGLVESIAVREGDRVLPGQELLRLDSRVAQTAVQEAQASLKQALMQQAANELDVDEDTVALRRVTLDRTRALFEQGLVARADLETKELELKAAERAVERARRNLDTNLARISQLEAAVERAQTELQHTIVRAPFEAWVIRRQVEVGSGVSGVSQSSSGGTVVLTLGEARKASLQANVTAADARRLEAGMPARLRLDSEPERVRPGHVESVATAGDQDAQTRLTTFPVVIAVDGSAESSWINVPAQVEIVIGSREDVIVVPDTCLRTDPDGRTYVFLQDGERPAQSHTVQIGTTATDRVEITNGLSVGQTLLCR
jgi:multidrug efflux pump subunit AcrA (membrane-fusion protein)